MFVITDVPKLNRKKSRHMLPQKYVATAVCYHSSMLPQQYVATAICCHSNMLPQQYVAAWQLISYKWVSACLGHSSSTLLKNKRKSESKFLRWQVVSFDNKLPFNYRVSVTVAERNWWVFVMKQVASSSPS